MGMTNRQFQAFMRLVRFVQKLISETIKDEAKKQQLEEEFSALLDGIVEDGTK